MKVTLREVTQDNVRAVCRLAVGPTQGDYVAPNAVSLAQALVHPEAWYRAIYVDDVPAGFVMVYDESLRSPPPPTPKVGLWRLMVDAGFQGQGVGRAGLERVIEHVRAKGVCNRFTTSYVPGPEAPEPFYVKMGFRPTGAMDGDEVELQLTLGALPAASPVGAVCVRRCQDAKDPGWLELRATLWGDCPRDEQLKEMAELAANPERFAQFVAADANGRAIGLAEAAVRADYVNGLRYSPGAFLEGIYVRPESRRQGVARALIEKVEAWGRSRGCRELASDAAIDSAESHAVHRALGFEETERVVYFRRLST